MKYTGPKVKLSRQLNLPLSPKAIKFMNRKPYPPGMYGERRGSRAKMSDYKRHLLENDMITVKPKSRKLECFITAVEDMINLPPAYIDRSMENWSAKLLYFPKRDEVPVSGDVPLIIEYYSR